MLSQTKYIHPTWVDLLTLALIARYHEMHPARARAIAERFAAQCSRRYPVQQ